MRPTREPRIADPRLEVSVAASRPGQFGSDVINLLAHWHARLASNQGCRVRHLERRSAPSVDRRSAPARLRRGRRRQCSPSVKSLGPDLGPRLSLARMVSGPCADVRRACRWYRRCSLRIPGRTKQRYRTSKLFDMRRTKSNTNKQIRGHLKFAVMFNTCFATTTKSL